MVCFAISQKAIKGTAMPETYKEIVTKANNFYSKAS